MAPFIGRYSNKETRVLCRTPMEGIRKLAKHWTRSKRKQQVLRVVQERGELTTEELCRAVGWKVRTCSDGSRRYSSYETRKHLVYMKLLATGRRGRFTTYTPGPRFPRLEALLKKGRH